MSRTDLANMIDFVVGTASIARYEVSRIIPTVDTAARMAAALRVRPQDLTEWKDDAKK